MFSIPKPKPPRSEQVFRSSSRKLGGITPSADGRLLLSSHSFLVAALMAKASGREIVAPSGRVLLSMAMVVPATCL